MGDIDSLLKSSASLAVAKIQHITTTLGFGNQFKDGLTDGLKLWLTR